MLLVSGSLHCVLTAIFLTLEKSDDGRVNAGKKETLKMAVNRKLCGAIIGTSVSIICSYTTVAVSVADVRF